MSHSPETSGAAMQQVRDYLQHKGTCRMLWCPWCMSAGMRLKDSAWCNVCGSFFTPQACTCGPDALLAALPSQPAALQQVIEQMRMMADAATVLHQPGINLAQIRRWADLLEGALPSQGEAPKGHLSCGLCGFHTTVSEELFAHKCPSSPLPQPPSQPRLDHQE